MSHRIFTFHGNEAGDVRSDGDIAARACNTASDTRSILAALCAMVLFFAIHYFLIAYRSAGDEDVSTYARITGADAGSLKPSY